MPKQIVIRAKSFGGDHILPPILGGLLGGQEECCIYDIEAAAKAAPDQRELATRALEHSVRQPVNQTKQEAFHCAFTNHVARGGG